MELERLAGQANAPVDTLVLLARCYLAVGQYEHAKKVAERLSKVRRGKSHAVLVQSQIDLETGSYKSALKRLKKELKAHPRNFEARIQISRAKAALGAMPDELTDADAIADFWDKGHVKGAEGLTLLGQALHMTAYYKDSTEIFYEARDADPGYLPALLHHAELFMTAENYESADQALSQVLRVNPHHSLALALMARIDVYSDNNHAGAIKRSKKALLTNPKSVSALQAWALALMDIEQFSDALVPIKKALAVNPNDAVSLALQAGCSLLLEDSQGYKAAERRAMKSNPRNALFFHTVAELALRHHRYVDAIRLERRALKLAPWYWPAKVGLGISYSRTGDDEKANKYLQAAYEDANINTRAVNMTAHFYDGPAQQMKWFKAGPFRVRVPKQEKNILSAILPDFLKEAYDTNIKRYGFKPKAPLHIELFAQRETFAVRTTGYPNLGYHGVCFGHVVTAISPSVGDFNWAMVMWHELAHVWHLQMSRSRVPRWFTEGLAEHETTLRRPEWKREMDRALSIALKNKRLEGVGKFNMMFINAKTGQDIVLAYYFASKVVAYIDGQWGFSVFPKMLKAWGAGKTTPVVFRDVLGVTLAEFDGRIRTHLKATLLPQYASEFVPTSGENADAISKAFQSGVEALKGKLWPEAAKAFKTVASAGKKGWMLSMMQARAAVGSQQWPEAKTHLEHALRQDPQARSTYSLLRRVLKKLGDAKGEYIVLKKASLLAEESIDLVLDVLRLATEQKVVADQIEFGERALHIRPFDPEVLVFAGNASLLNNKPAQAIKRAKLASSMSKKVLPSARLLQARALLKLGKKVKARRILETLGDNAEAKAVLDEL